MDDGLNFSTQIIIVEKKEDGINDTDHHREGRLFSITFVVVSGCCPFRLVSAMMDVYT